MRTPCWSDAEEEVALTAPLIMEVLPKAVVAAHPVFVLERLEDKWSHL